MSKKLEPIYEEFDIVTILKGYGKGQNALVLRMKDEKGHFYWATKFQNGVSYPLVKENVKYHGRLDLGGF